MCKFPTINNTFITFTYFCNTCRNLKYLIFSAGIVKVTDTYETDETLDIILQHQTVIARFLNAFWKTFFEASEKPRLKLSNKWLQAWNAMK